MYEELCLWSYWVFYTQSWPDNWVFMGFFFFLLGWPNSSSFLTTTLWQIIFYVARYVTSRKQSFHSLQISPVTSGGDLPGYISHVWTGNSPLADLLRISRNPKQITTSLVHPWPSSLSEHTLHGCIMHAQ